MSRGHARERAVKLHLENEDWWVARAAGSLGDADLVALKQGRRPMLVEVKSTAGGPYERFGPTERAGADATLAWWPPRGTLRWIPSSEWPVSLKAVA